MTKQDTKSEVKILVVDDNKVNQLLVKNILKKFGFSLVDTAESGKAALDKLSKGTFDLILMDVQMPEMDGYEATRIIRAHPDPGIRNLPVIALTGDAATSEKTKAKEAGMNAYIVKPYTPEELYSTLLKYIQLPSNFAPSTTLSSSNEGMDLSFLSKFTDGDQSITIQLTEIFLQQVPEAIQKIEHLISEKNWSQIFPIAHKVKSSFAIFELNELKDAIASIEEYSREQKNLEEIPGLFQKVKSESEIAVRNLGHELKKLKATIASSKD